MDGVSPYKSAAQRDISLVGPEKPASKTPILDGVDYKDIVTRASPYGEKYLRVYAISLLL